MTPTGHRAWSRALLRPPITKPHLPDTQHTKNSTSPPPCAAQLGHGGHSPISHPPHVSQTAPVTCANTRVSWCGGVGRAPHLPDGAAPHLYPLLCSFTCCSLAPHACRVHARIADVTCPMPVHASLRLCTPRLDARLAWVPPCLAASACALSHTGISRWHLYARPSWGQVPHGLRLHAHGR